MTANGDSAARLLRRRPARARQAARRLHGARLRGRADGPRPRSAAPARAPASTASAACDPKQEMGWNDVRGRDAGSSTSLGLLVVYALQRLQGVLPLNPQDLGAVVARLVVQHRGELRDQHQLAGLRRRDDDELPHADARARPCRTSSRRRPAWRCWSRSIRGFARRTAQTIGNFWVDLTRSTLYILLPLVARARARAGLAGRRADASRPTRRSLVSRSLDSRSRRRRQPVRTAGQAGHREPEQTSPSARRRRRSRSSSSAPTAAASSTSTRRTRSRTRRRSPTSSRCWRSC